MSAKVQQKKSGKSDSSVLRMRRLAGRASGRSRPWVMGRSLDAALLQSVVNGEIQPASERARTMQHRGRPALKLEIEAGIAEALEPHGRWRSRQDAFESARRIEKRRFDVSWIRL